MRDLEIRRLAHPPCVSSHRTRPRCPALGDRRPAALARNETWQHFNGDLKAQKFSTLTQITPANVKSLRVAWRMRTGDVSNGPKPATGWSATPLFVNDTIYLGTPFYRILALEPDTGKVKWSYDSKAVLEPSAQASLKNGGVAYWQADRIAPGQPCQKRVYIGTDGREAACGRCRYRQALRGFRQ